MISISQNTVSTCHFLNDLHFYNMVCVWSDFVPVCFVFLSCASLCASDLSVSFDLTQCQFLCVCIVCICVVLQCVSGFECQCFFRSVSFVWFDAVPFVFAFVSFAVVLCFSECRCFFKCQVVLI